MNLKNLTIKKNLTITAITISVMLVSIGMFTVKYTRNVFEEYEYINLLKDIKQLELKIRKAEKEFLAYETKNPDFFLTGKSKYLDEIDNDLNLIESYTIKLSEAKTIYDLNLNEKLKNTQKLFSDYENNMKKLSIFLVKKGFKDFGMIGKMRNDIHSVEKEILKYDNKNFNIYMLTLRRHEKDYLLRKDLKYKDKFAKVCDKFILEISESNQDKYLNLIPLINNYQSIFNNVIAMDIKIGLTPEDGLNDKILKTINKIETNLAELSLAFENTAKKEITKTSMYMIFLISFISLIIIFTFWMVSKHIVKSISNLKDFISRLGKGELPEHIKVISNDEIGQMKKSINILVSNLKSTKEFAEAVGNGNFTKEVDVFNNKGDLGTALVDMRKKLLQVSDEREKQILESNQRLWANEGLAKINALFSNNTNNKTLYINVISSLTKYLNANQGSILLTDNYGGEIVLKQEATYAFDRNKISNKTIKIGEGIAGAVAYEKQTVHITDVPENYIKITSGLGDATPNSLLIVPCITEDELIGIIELASFNYFEKYQIDFVETVATYIAANIKKNNIEITTKKLLEKTQKQTIALTEKEEEMRQNLEELKAIQEVMMGKEEQMSNKIKVLEKENFELSESNKKLQDENIELRANFSEFADEFSLLS